MYPNSNVERVEVNDHWVFENDIYLITFKGDSGKPFVIPNRHKEQAEVFYDVLAFKISSFRR